MAKFVLAGKTDCPYYAKAELLADTLQQCLPDFKIHKISILPDEWKEWLGATCEKNNWKHEGSPLVWRELVEQGGKGMLLGGFNDFLEHCQVFPNVSAISLRLLDLEGNEEQLQSLRLEIEELAISMLHQVTTGTDLERAFRKADVILLLDDGGHDGENEGEEVKKKKVKVISERYKEYGQLIDATAKETVKVIVSGDSFLNLRCSLLVDSARSIDSHQFIAAAAQLENEAKAVLGKKMRMRPSDITDVIVWGNISGTFYIDLQRAKVFNHDGPITGPAFFSQPLLSIFPDRKWLETDFQHLVRRRRLAVTSKTGQAAATSAANGILTVLKAWNGASDPDVLSSGVACPGHYSLPDGIVFSVPLTFTDGKWSVVSELTVENELKYRLELSASELQQEKQFGSDSGTTE
ncbi:putative malate dehydrogenase 1B isoform X3 [Astatotilapia calliptera]|uniref:putative malate dehydrogenase 1B isoform X3 n=1 Tax=Astatotilapia calliptera TaxID=8154 RepID=UPI000D305A07|nr:putative malate dehydrogenase 1B isoform X1 [Maylandia zebra]XP_026014987.1 putative malate dehydrogenase 1B isoform X3 [Astatotilapia calliptera]